MIEELVVDLISKHHRIKSLGNGEYSLGYNEVSVRIKDAVFSCLWDGFDFTFNISLNDPNAFSKILKSCNDGLSAIRDPHYYKYP